MLSYRIMLRCVLIYYYLFFCDILNYFFLFYLCIGNISWCSVMFLSKLEFVIIFVQVTEGM